MANPELYKAHILIPQQDGSTHRGLAGTFMIKDGQLHHLASYHDDALAHALPEGAITAAIVKALHSPPANLQFAKRDDIGAGHHLDFIPEHPLDRPLEARPNLAHDQNLVQERLPSVFHYQRAGHDRPHVLEVDNGQYLLDGHTLSHIEVRKIIDNLKNRSATLRYRTGGAENAIRKAEQVFRGLRKADEEEMDPSAALTHLSGLQSEDPKTAAAIKALRRHIYEDPMMVGLGNRYAWNEFAAKNQPGVYGSLDLNDLKATNDTLGHEAGDKLIRGFGASARDAADQAAPGQIKLFRTGGDEVAMHATSPEHAYSFLSALRDKLNDVPAINGTHRISMSAGIGPDYATADKALYEAKKTKYLPTTVISEGAQVRKYKPGQVPHLIHSLMPGAEGPIPQDTNVKMPVVHPPAEALPSPSPAVPAPASPKPAQQPISATT